MKHGPAIKPLPAALHRALRELQRSRIAQAEAPPPATLAAPPGPALDLDALQASAQRRLQDWIDDEASRIAVTLAKLSRRQQRMFEVWRLSQPEPEWIAA